MEAGLGGGGGGGGGASTRTMEKYTSLLTNVPLQKVTTASLVMICTCHNPNVVHQKRLQ